MELHLVEMRAVDRLVSSHELQNVQYESIESTVDVFLSSLASVRTLTRRISNHQSITVVHYDFYSLILCSNFTIVYLNDSIIFIFFPIGR